MNHPKRTAGAKGRRHPPAANLIGRADACRILGIDKRKLRRLEKNVLLPAVVEHDGAHWFDVSELRRVAVAIQEGEARARRRSRPSGVQLRAKTGVPSAPKYAPEVAAYYPENEPPGRARPRRAPPAPAQATLKMGPTAPARGPETSTPSIRSGHPPEHPRRSLTQVPDSWFTDESIPTWPHGTDNDDDD